MEEQQKLWSEIFKPGMEEKSVALLMMFRNEKVKLSQMNIKKGMFNCWKKQGLLDSFLDSKFKWNFFNFGQEIAVILIDTLWKYNLNNDDIKIIISKLFKDDFIKKELEDFIKSSNAKNIFDSYSNKRPNLLNYIFNQRKENHHLPVITNIEAYLLLILQYGMQVSILY